MASASTTRLAQDEVTGSDVYKNWNRLPGGIWGVPRLSATIVAVPKMRIRVYWGLYWGPPIFGNCHIATSGVRSEESAPLSKHFLHAAVSGAFSRRSLKRRSISSSHAPRGVSATDPPSTVKLPVRSRQRSGLDYTILRPARL